jgi:hypothetical protein
MKARNPLQIFWRLKLHKPVLEAEEETLVSLAMVKKVSRKANPTTATAAPATATATLLFPIPSAIFFTTQYPQKKNLSFAICTQVAQDWNLDNLAAPTSSTDVPDYEICGGNNPFRSKKTCKK